MADSQRYYYLKLKENFFESDSMVLLENMKDGYLYSNILMKLYLKSLKDGGRLMLNGTIPYNSQMLASVTRHQVGTLEKALEIFKELGLIEVLDSGAIYMMDIQNFIGRSSTEADRQRDYQSRIKNEKQISCKKSNMESNRIPTPEIEIEKEIEIETDTLQKKYNQIIDLYNDTCVSLPRVLKLSESRKKAIKARLRQYTIDDFCTLFNMAETSSFLKGQNDRNWTADFDWLIHDRNMAKVLEGKYANKKGGHHCETDQYRGCAADKYKQYGI